MAFRAYEKSQEGRDLAVANFISRHFSDVDRKRSETGLHDMIDKYGPVVASYPSWHPLVTSANKERETNDRSPTTPSQNTGYEGLDNTLYLQNGFITCPKGDAEAVLESVDNLKQHPIAWISAETLQFPLYAPNATPVLVKCVWRRDMERDGTIPKSIAVPLMIEHEIPGWAGSKYAETWETMRRNILGTPRGSRSSLFVNQETGQALKSVYNALIYTGMFGAIRV